MLGKLLMYFAVAAAAYWYWTGPYQDGKMSDYGKELQENDKKMALCIRAKNYNLGATGNVGGVPEEVCAEQYNLYLKDGQWHSYNSVRKD
jgi:hypothetical protein